MKKLFLTSIFFYVFVLMAQAQEPRFIFQKDSVLTAFADSVGKFKAKDIQAITPDSLNKIPPAISSWHINPLLGERIPIEVDTMLYGFHRESLVEGQGLAMGYLGNWGSPAKSKLFFEQEESSLFQFLDAYSIYYKAPGNQRFLSTKQPHSNIMYQSGGGGQTKEERFTGELSMSFGKRLTVGFDMDYVYSRGFYQYNSAKQINYDIYAAYLSDKYQMHAFVGNNNYTNSENGGLLYDGYLNGTNPDGIGKNNSLNFQTRLTNTWNYLRGRHLYLTNKYNLGYYKGEGEEFVPVASVLFTTHYTDQLRRFYSRDIQSLDDFYLYQGNREVSVNDQMGYYSFSNTVGLTLNEGFKPWVKFGLTGYIRQDNRLYRMPMEQFMWMATTEVKQSATHIGGVLSKEKGEVLKYNLSADLGVLGFDLGEFTLNADISTAIRIKGEKAIVRAKGYVKNLIPQYLETTFVSKYYQWQDLNLKATKRVYAGGEIYIPHTETRLSGGVENLTNYIYIERKKNQSSSEIKPQQGDAQVLSLRLDQNLHYGILHWDNQVSFQTSTMQGVVPVPMLSLYTNLYIKTSLAKVLTMQLGVDAHYHTKYHAQGYDPALGQFINQTDVEVGNFPFTTAYANLHLKKTRFFLMMYNIASGFGDSNYFSIPHYPVNPTIFKFGLSWNFTN